tara:strand:- start:845 stop:1111 length:267 start_codon:yes stop_codon:yes gene_type:complete
MKKFFAITIIIFLILFTALIKNSTKRIDDEIFISKENTRFLRKEIEDLKLEYTYLSSGKKLIDFKIRFFDQDLNSKNKNKIKILENND